MPELDADSQKVSGKFGYDDFSPFDADDGSVFEEFGEVLAGEGETDQTSYGGMCSFQPQLISISITNRYNLIAQCSNLDS